MTPNTGAFDENVISDAMAAVFEKSGDGILMTHSQGGDLVGGRQSKVLM